MDLNFPLPDTNPKGNAPQHSTVKSVHPPTNQEFMVKQLNVNQRVPDKMSDWFVQMATVSNPRRALEQLQKLNPPAFKGEADPIQAEEWLHQIEEILDVMKCNENQRVSFTSLMLYGEVERWWKMVKDGAKTFREEIS